MTMTDEGRHALPTAPLTSIMQAVADAAAARQRESAAKARRDEALADADASIRARIDAEERLQHVIWEAVRLTADAAPSGR